jgi:L-alanine-DL-glutamate epimerase-like enolase superfamily enzyme
LEVVGEEMASYVEMGYRAVKIKTGALSLEDELTRVRVTRDAIGPDTLLMLDMNAPYGVEDCIKFANAVAPYDIFWLEEPLHWHLQPADYVRLAAGSPIPLAHGEREWTRFTIRDFINSGALKYVQFDSTRHAGFTESLRIAHLAEQQGVIIAPHTAPQIHGHLASAFADAAFGAESHAAHDRRPFQHRLYSKSSEYRDGMVHLNDDPGFGIEVNWEYLETIRA